MRRLPPIEYGDNFPAPSVGTLWDPTVPWRFPKHQVRLRRPSMLHRSMPWIMLGIGMILGVLWMSWRLDLPSGSGRAPSLSSSDEAGQVGSPRGAPSQPPLMTPRVRPLRSRSQLA